MVEADQQSGVPEPVLVSAIEEADKLIWDLAGQTGASWDTVVDAMLQVQKEERIGSIIGQNIGGALLFLAKVTGLALPPDETEDTKLMRHFEPDQYIGPPGEFIAASEVRVKLNKKFNDLK